MGSSRLASSSVLLWAFVFTLLAATDGRKPDVGDAVQMCAAASALVRGQGLAVQPGRADIEAGPDGRYYVKYSLLSVLQCVPALGLRAAARWARPNDPQLSLLALALVPNALGATLAVGILRLALALQSSLRAALILALAVPLTTPLWYAARTLYSETLQAALLVFSLWMIVRSRTEHGRRAAIAAGVLAGLCLNAKVLLAVVPIALVIDLGFERGQKRVRNALGSFPGLCAGAVAFGWYNQVRFGSPLAQGYGLHRDGALGFNVPLVAGLHGLLFSSGKSLFLYAPLCTASVWLFPRLARTRPRDALLLMIPFLGTLLVVAKWWAWSGDWAWGPRLLTPVIALACLPAASALARPGWASRAVLLLAAAGAAVQLLGNIVYPRFFFEATAQAGKNLVGRHTGLALRDDLLPVHFIPEFNPIAGHCWLLERYLARDREPWTDTSYYPWQSLGVPSFRPRADPTPPELNLWFGGDPSALVIGVECALIALTLVLGVCLYLHARRACRTELRG